MDSYVSVIKQLSVISMFVILSHLELGKDALTWMSVSISSKLHVIFTIMLAQVVAGPLAVVRDSCELSPCLFIAYY